jgi:heat shock protein HslJ
MTSIRRAPRLLAVMTTVLIASPAVAQDAATSPLSGTAWQLVKFVGGDDTTLTPTDPALYTIEFDETGRVAARIDCNRGSGTWKTDGKASLEFGPMALTRAMCPPGSLHDQIAKQWTSIRSFVIRDGHLFLSLMADGGTYEYAPRPAPAPVSPVKATGPVIFDCRAQGTEVGELHATFYATQPGLVMLEHVGLAKPAFQVRAASGAKYEGDGVSFWEARGEATVRWPGSDMTCKRR